MFKLISRVLLAAGLLGSAWAQGLPSAVVSTPQLRAELVAHAPQGVQAGQPVWVGLQLSHQPEWHTYWRNPGDSGLPTQIELDLPAGITAGDVQWPLPHKLKAGNLTNYGYDKTVLLAVPLTVSKEYKPKASQTLDLQVRANWLVCRLECIPQEGDFTLRIPVNSSYAPQAAAFDAVQAQQPQALPNVKATTSFDAQRLVMKVSGLPAALQGQTLSVFPNAPEVLESAAEQHPRAIQSWQDGVWTVQLPLSNLRLNDPKELSFVLTAGEGSARQGFEVSAAITQAWPAVSELPAATAPAVAPVVSDEGALGFVLALLGAFVGGLILNLMPCVLPVLAIKLLGFAQHSRAHRAHRVAGMAYTAGVVLSFLALGAGVLALRAAGEQLGWGFQLQSPVVVSVLAAFFTLIALNLFGLFEFGQILPSRVASFQYKHPVMDAGLSGVLAVAVASPCTAPFMGASLGLAMTLPTWQALSIFVAMGLGLAAPYLLASFMPAVARLLPHPGPWMVTLRQLLAFPMLATVVWLLWVLGQQTSLDATMFALGGLLLLAAFIWAVTQHSRAARGVAWLLAAALAWGAMNFAEELKAPATGAVESNTTTSNGNAVWQPWSEAAVAQSLAQGRPVFVDFTAAWCVTCQINKKSTLSNSEVLADFAAHQVTLMRADWTRRDPAITAALTALGRSGVPVYVLHAPGKAPLVLSELLSVSKMKEALATLPAADPTKPATGFALPAKPNSAAIITRN
ncbi:MAG: protein-disulfide reductase [Burkholderiales bacterium 35-55-47]|jgi:thiol:disulfide interchange protein DsbD|uniref:protein-disulfide reductase DsbD family protein n=1 Tax=Limnohabitans sp. TaxID=1907725 RepID=UPI000BC3908F|nr:thioredoxin family protein [Limnohabitans sp.]OYY17382.1 MAG: protein-disulfide reductase [Burkholderiales bacterium 35-55-47]OYZ71950.1 MAG: protein-disulfide reductase [Burkholderiales bacterium 24-55-52]OZA98969.1 MAG: protein-disulfide reductase [Burkholderiales bacterium 39-55-53]HQR87639.1 thioredoxin family protein [Limnohabitans sp.]HQS28101.1 thioredoxin family protein [Limnohabitans sp.]